MSLSLISLVLTLSLQAVPLATARTDAAQARASLGAIRTQQMSKRQELNQLAARIETLKAKAKGKLLKGGELDVALKESQTLSDALSELARNVSSKEAASERAQAALLESLSAELTAQRARFDTQTDRAQRKALIASMRSLRGEREQVRASLPSSALPKVEEAVAPNDDPEALLELADAMRDDEDKVQKKLAQLEVRIKEAKEERALDQRMRQFMDEDALFDEQDRRVRVQREVTLDVQGTPSTAVGAAADKALPKLSAQQVPPRTVGSELMPSAGGFADSTQGARSMEAVPPPLQADGPPVSTVGNNNPPRTETQRAADNKPVVGTLGLAGSDNDDLEELEVQRKKLKSLAEQLKTRALELEKKAQTLK
ncbi:MAG: TetR family transcriptional regulator [Myxococcaceae bacterium]|nr:TetR family transcriptional regulator [Myxococcaceae bacterium]